MNDRSKDLHILGDACLEQGYVEFLYDSNSAVRLERNANYQ